MSWSEAERREELLRAPEGAHVLAPDSRVVSREGWYQVVTPSVADPSLNEVVRAQLSPEEADGVIDATLEEYRGHGVPFKWVVGPDSSPADLAERLEARGLESWWARGMACDPEVITLPPLGEGVGTQEVGQETFRSYCEVLADGWKLDLERVLRDQAALADRAGPLHYGFLVKHHGEPAAAGSYVAHPRSAYLTGAVVIREFRGRGLYKALIRARIKHAIRRGKTLATTQAREDTSAPILERGGWETVYRFRVFAGQ